MLQSSSNQKMTTNHFNRGVPLRCTKEYAHFVIDVPEIHHINGYLQGRTRYHDTYQSSNLFLIYALHDHSRNDPNSYVEGQYF